MAMTEATASSQRNHPLTAYSWVLFAYLVPIILYGGYAVRNYSASGSWTTLSLGLVLSLFGSVLIILCMRQWELTMRNRVAALLSKNGAGAQSLALRAVEQGSSTAETELSQHAILQYEKQVQELQQELNTLETNWQQREEEVQQLLEEYQTLKQESGQIDQQMRSSSNEMAHKEHLLQEYQQTITEQRSIIEKKQQYILKLENKVQDLNYEVKTLLQLGDMQNTAMANGEKEKQSPHPVMDVFNTPYTSHEDLEEIYQSLPMSSDKKVHTPYDAAMQLERCIDKAKKLTGASHLAGSSSRFLDLSVDSYAIDLRRLFDSFRNENSCGILLYSQQEQRLLFVNNTIKTLLGWSPERFVSDFEQIIRQSAPEWKHALTQLQGKNETQARLLIKAKSGEDVLVQCYLGVVTEGVFAQHIIGVIYTN